MERQKFTSNPVKFGLELIRCVQLLNIDFSKTLENIPKDKVVVVRGKRYIFYCDDKAVTFLRSKGMKVLEYEGGHNLSEKLEDTVDGLTL